MSDFYQQGLICTLQRLGNPSGSCLETQLIASEPCVTLVLPCHYSELGQPALEHVVKEVSTLTFLREVVISMNGMDAAGAHRARAYFAQLPQTHRVLWNDAPPVRKLVEAAGIPFESGKGFNYWAACGLILKEGVSKLIVTQDCDVSSFDRDMLLRISAAVALDGLNYDFAKMYYSRSTDRIHGRVSRLFLAPLLRSLVRILGHHPLLDFLLSFRYPLAGEFAIRCDLAGALALPNGWGLEIGLLCEVFRHTDPRQVCQVDAGSNYEHKHQTLGSSGSGLIKMAREIAQSLFHYLAEEGIKTDSSFLSALRATFPREADEAMRRYHNLALINGLVFDETEEKIAVDAFCQMLQSLELDEPAVFLPPWRNLLGADWSQEFFGAICQ
jgi:glucosyl-3-phosphoglycerate synthase